METFDLTEGCDECEDVSGLCLVGKILTPKTLNRTVVSNVLQNAWKSRSQLEISPWGDNVYLFQFSESKDRCKVHGVPLDKMSKKHGETIGNCLGKLIAIEALSDGLFLGKSFLRIRVEIDVTKPLLQGFILHRHSQSGKTLSDVRILYKYKKLSEFCYDCGRIGHDNTSCKFTSKADGANLGYGLDMRTGMVKHIGAPHGSYRQPPVKDSNANSLVRRSTASLSSAYHTEAIGGHRDRAPVPVASVPVRGEREAEGILSCMPTQDFPLPQDTTCLPKPDSMQVTITLSESGPA
ncbi:hypothetical protein ACSBR1_032466 [Camellia fascicularis]